MSGSSWIDSTGDTPQLKAGAAATGFIGTILVRWYAGLIEFIGSAGRGINDTIDGLGEWLTGMYLALPEGAAGVITAAAASNAEWIASLGTLGYVVAVVEGVAIFLLMVGTVRTAISWVTGS